MDSKQAVDQASKYSESIGSGLPLDSLSALSNFSRDASRRDWFAKHDNVPFWFERFDKAGLTEKISILADTWAQSEDNVERAAAQVRRPKRPATKDLVVAFGVYKFKRYLKEQWELVQSPACGFEGKKEAQTMVCVAPDDLGPTNGFPFELKRGQDVCIDGDDTLLLPPTGGGMARLIWIAL